MGNKCGAEVRRRGERGPLSTAVCVQRKRQFLDLGRRTVHVRWSTVEPADRGSCLGWVAIGGGGGAAGVLYYRSNKKEKALALKAKKAAAARRRKAREKAADLEA